MNESSWPDEGELVVCTVTQVKDFVAWGEITPETLETLMRTRGRLEGNTPLTDDYVRETTSYAGIAELAGALVEGEMKLRDVPGLKPVLRLHPPRKGYKSLKRTYPQGGALGYYGPEINELLYKMR